jgi:hypothetical protein
MTERSQAQTTTLLADGRNDPYQLIDAALGGVAYETPDCSHPAFGPHITQIYDSTLRKVVFSFWIHAAPDNDRCIALDRQRTEIKAYSPSPDIVKAFADDRVDFRWQVLLGSGFQPSPRFTHLHQIKAGDGNADDPLITLSAYSGAPEVLRINHWDDAGVETVLASTDLAPFKGTWVEVDEAVRFGWIGAYAIAIRRVSDGALLFSYENDDLQLWRTGTTFSRPKWGIYRSLDDATYLRDEEIRFGGFCIGKGVNCPGFAATTQGLYALPVPIPAGAVAALALGLGVAGSLTVGRRARPHRTHRSWRRWGLPSRGRSPNLRS